MRGFVFLFNLLILVGVHAQVPVDNNAEFKIPLQKGILKPVPNFTPICKQASFICDNHLVCLSNDGHAKAYPLFNSKDSVEFDLDCVSQKPHCNVANLVKRNGKNYLYVSEWNNSRRFFVEEIGWNKSTNTWESKLVQIFSLNMPASVSGDGYTDWVVDAKNKKLYAHTYKGAQEWNDRSGSGVVLLEFNLPDPESGNHVFDESEVLRRAEYPMIFVTQDKEIYKNRLFITAGLRTSKKGNWDFSRKVVIINLKNLQVEKIIDLSHYNDEPEGIDFYKGKTLITYRRGMFLLK